MWRFAYSFLRWKSTEKTLITNKSRALSSRLDELLRTGLKDSDPTHQEKVLDIAKSMLKQTMPLHEEAAIIGKLKFFKTLNDSFWLDYVSKLDKRLDAAYNLRQQGNVDSVDEHTDNRDINMRTLLRISRHLVDANVSSSSITTLFVKWVKHNGYYLVPHQMSSFNGMLEYLAHVGNGQNIAPDDFDVVGECVQGIKPYHLVDTLYLLGKLRIKNEAMIKTVGRVLHNEIAKGLLTPYHKTKLARAYAMLQHEHITFFKHIAEELRIIFEWKDAGKCLNVAAPVGGRYIEGIGSDECFQPSGAICDVIPYMLTEVDRTESGAQRERAVFTGASEQLYTDGQIIYILDSMMYLKLHHLEPYFRKLLHSAIKHCYVTSSLEQFDVEQLRSAVTLVAQCRKVVDDNVLETISRRFIQAFVDGNCKPAQLALFLKYLVKQTRKIVKTVNRRNRVSFKANFVPPKWLGKPLSEAETLLGGRSQPSMLEACCTKICENVYRFNISDLTLAIRSVAYLGFRNESFYKAFIPYFKEQVSALTKVGIKEEHLFSLMAKRHQLYLHGIDKAHNLYVKRIG
ncbi:hypothetical protein X943_001579 [Babesia divergens]|uniref:Uncharacterized protein n=1 Tax=Babesia divergens TaxID=32595 RepID=A0AAD9GD10_BABDI|nr:hypothetical protein X943_001579 [Babesia divergens]